eukprot:2293154-Prymnesium_polylepis.1
MSHVSEGSNVRTLGLPWRRRVKAGGDAVQPGCGKAWSPDVTRRSHCLRVVLHYRVGWIGVSKAQRPAPRPVGSA